MKVVRRTVARRRNFCLPPLTVSQPGFLSGVIEEIHQNAAVVVDLAPLTVLGCQGMTIFIKFIHRIKGAASVPVVFHRPQVALSVLHHQHPIIAVTTDNALI